MSLASPVFRRIHGRFALFFIVLWLITSGPVVAQARAPLPAQAAALDTPGGPGAFSSLARAQSPNATVNVIAVTTIEKFYLNRLTATHNARLSGTFPTSFTFTPHKAAISNLTFSHAGGTCQKNSNNSVRCTGTMTAFEISYRYVAVIEPRGMYMDATTGHTSDMYGAMKVDVRYPTSLACVGSSLPPTTKAAGLLRWENANTKKLAPTINFRLGSDCANLQALEDDYRSKIGKKDEWYAHFWLCLNTNACAEYARTGEDGPAGGFGKYMFDYMKAHSESSALRKPCLLPSDTPASDETKLLCFNITGLIHFANELRPGFLSYARQLDPAKFDAWDAEHDAFVATYNLPCFREVLQTTFPDRPQFRETLITDFQKATKASATRLREFTQWYVLRGSDSQVRANTAVLTGTYPPAPTYADLYSSDLFAASDLKATAANDAFFLPVGSATRLVVSGTPAGAESATTYTVLAPADVATITADGLLTIHKTTSPMLNERPLLRVLVQNGALVGIAQFAIQDSDADSDLLADSYEAAAGLSPTTPNSLSADLDGDGLSDHWELMLRSDPQQSDTDGDGYSDLAEFTVGSDFLNPICTPKGCVYSGFLPLLRR